jgi:hypothetical protein
MSFGDSPRGVHRPSADGPRRNRGSPHCRPHPQHVVVAGRRIPQHLVVLVLDCTTAASVDSLGRLSTDGARARRTDRRRAVGSDRLESSWRYSAPVLAAIAASRNCSKDSPAKAPAPGLRNPAREGQAPESAPRTPRRQEPESAPRRAPGTSHETRDRKATSPSHEPEPPATGPQATGPQATGPQATSHRATSPSHQARTTEPASVPGTPRNQKSR